jgi:hypothetical protein
MKRSEEIADVDIATSLVSGDSASFSGPMLVQPVTDGSNPPPLDAGYGTLRVTWG